MRKRLQVMMDEAEFRDVLKAARRERITVAEWVRQALREARRHAPGRDAAKKLDVVRKAVQHEFPTSDVDRTLDEIERGYLQQHAP